MCISPPGNPTLMCNMAISSYSLHLTALEKLSIRLMERIPIVAAAHKHNLDYLKTKAVKIAHLLFEGKK